MASFVCNTENRLGRGGAEEIKAHAFFRGVQWNSLRQVSPTPFAPTLTSNIDSSNFPIDEIEQTPETWSNAQPTRETVAPETALPFVGYTFKRFDAFKKY
jgi:protein-serine/threonine kinase